MIDAYFHFKKVAGKKSKYLLAHKAGVYEPLDATNKAGECLVYLTESSYLQSRRQRQANFALSNPKFHHLTGVFIPEPSKPNLAFGDFKRQDGWLIVIGEGFVEILVLAGKATAVKTLHSMLCDGEFDSELQAMRKQAGAGE
jgi:hypothetical protein